jgi:hypothetical protein
VNDVFLANLNAATHVEVEIQEPVPFLGSAAKEACVAGQATGRCAAGLQLGDDRIFTERFGGIALVLLGVCHPGLHGPKGWATETRQSTRRVSAILDCHEDHLSQMIVRIS